MLVRSVDGLSVSVGAEGVAQREGTGHNLCCSCDYFFCRRGTCPVVYTSAPDVASDVAAQEEL